MNCSTSLSLPATAVIANTARLVARIEKSSAGNGLHDGRAADEKRQETQAPRLAQRALSHSETEAAPRWYGGRLSAPFVAQILGQVLAQDVADAASARAAYASARMNGSVGSRFDETI